MPYIQRERHLLAEYIGARYPLAHVMPGLRLGPVPEDLVAEYGAAQALKVGRTLRPEVDCVVIESNTLVLIEAKIHRWLDGLCKLYLYNALVADTPELKKYVDYARRAVLVVPFTQPIMQRCCQLAGIELDVFTTPATEDFIKNILPRYNTHEYKRGRQERQAAIRALGLEY